MALDNIPQVYRTDAAAQSHTTPEQNLPILPTLPSVMDKQESATMSTVTITVIAIVTYTGSQTFLCTSGNV